MNSEIDNQNKVAENPSAQIVTSKKTVEEQKQFLAQYEQLRSFEELLLQQKNMEQVYQVFSQNLDKVISYKSLAMLEIIPKNFEFDIVFPAQLNKELDFLLNTQLEIGNFGWALNKERPLIMALEDISPKPPSLMLKDNKPLSVIIFPIILSSKPLGALFLLSETRLDEINQNLLHVLDLQVKLLARTIERVRLNMRLQEQNLALIRTTAYLENILNNIVYSIIALDKKGNIALYNIQAEMTFGKKRQQVLAQPYQQVLPEPLIVEMDKILDKIKSKKIIVDYQFDYLSSQKISIPLKVTATTLYDAEKSRNGFILFFQDMFISREVVELKKLDQLKSDFISKVSHELRTPLSIIKGSAETLINYRDKMDISTFNNFINMIDRESDNLNMLIGNLLDLSRIEAGKIQMNFSEFNLEELIREVITIFSGKYSLARFQFSTEPDKMGLTADRDKIRQVLINLLENACKYTSAEIEVKIDLQAKKNKLLLTVEDNGPGIPLRYQPFIFDKFYRAKGGENKSGTGLGLAICKEIVELHAGEILLESEEGRGCKFIIFLPIAEDR